MLPDYVAVYTAEGQLNGEIIRVFLESHGIPARLVQESYGVTLGLTLGPMGVVHIWVPQERAEEAHQLLDAMEAGELELPDDVNLDENTDQHSSLPPTSFWWKPYDPNEES